jgi:hypothetical protein
VSGPANSANTDNYMAQASATTNNGTAVTVRAGKASTGSSALRSLFTFNVSDIPGGATIVSATLTFHVTTRTGTPGTGTINRLRRTDWDEANSTWNNYKTSTAWTTAGCGSTATDYDTSISGGTHAAPPSSGTFDVTGLAAIVQDGLTNHAGLVYLVWRLDTESNTTNIQVDSSDGTTAANRPKLVVVYH